MSEELIVSSSLTGQKENPELRARAKARKLKEKQDRTLADELLLACSEDTFFFKYKGIDIEVYSPTQADFAEFLELYNKTLTSDENKLSKEENEAIEEELYKVVAELCVDASITSELLKSGMLGTSFIPAFMNSIQAYNKKEVEEVAIVSKFRKK